MKRLEGVQLGANSHMMKHKDTDHIVELVVRACMTDDDKHVMVLRDRREHKDMWIKEYTVDGEYIDAVIKSLFGMAQADGYVPIYYNEWIHGGSK